MRAYLDPLGIDNELTMKNGRFVLLLLVLFTWTAACDGGCGSKEGKIPATAEGRVLDLAEQLPAKLEAGIFITDLKATRDAANELKDRLPQGQIVEGFQKQFQASFGIDLLDRESWARAGVAPDSTALVGSYRSRVVFMTYVENRQQFEKVLAEKAKAAFQIQSVTKNEDVGGFKMKVLSDNPGMQIAWLYEGKVAKVVMPATSAEGALNDGTASLVLADIAGTKKETSLASTAGFKGFQKDLASKYTVAVYLNAPAYMDQPEVKKSTQEDPNLEAASAWAKANLDYAGFGAKLDKDTLEIRANAGLKPETAKEFAAAAVSSAKLDWSGYSTENVLLAIRFGFDWQKVWDIFLKSMPEDERRSTLRNLKGAGEGVNLDIEADVLTQLTGNVGVFFYGLSGGAKNLMGGNPEAILKSAGLLGVIQLKSPEAVTNIVNKVMSPLAALATLRPVAVDDKPVEGWQVIEFNQPDAPGRIFINGDRIILSTLAFSEKSVLQYAQDKRDEKRLKDVALLDKGAGFGATEGFTGLYFNSIRARENLGGLLMMVPEAQILNFVQESSLQFGMDGSGGFAKLLVDLEPKTDSKPADAKPLPDKAPDTKPGLPIPTDIPAK